MEAVAQEEKAWFLRLLQETLNGLGDSSVGDAEEQLKMVMWIGEVHGPKYRALQVALPG
jgi:hypothetical protein